MLKSLYRKLALVTLRNHKENYLPFIFSSIGITAMHLILYALYKSPELSVLSGMATMQSILEMAVYINGFFALVFIFYTNNFLMKRRKREFALYNMLGMEKRHLIKILAWETLIIGCLGISFGVFFGSLLYKLAESLFLKIIQFPLSESYLPAFSAIIHTVALFGIIFMLNFIGSLLQLYFTRPAEMMRQSKAGEKPPRINWFYSLSGIVCLALGYYLAIKSESPIRAIPQFFVAVMLVVIGTYFNFQSVSILVLKLLQKSKGYYYQTRHFTSVSGLIFRIRQNAMGLANICLLSSVVLVMISSAVALHFGAEDIIRHRYPRNVLINMSQANLEQIVRIREVMAQTSDKLKIRTHQELSFRHLDLVSKMQIQEDKLLVKEADPSKVFTEDGYLQFLFIPLEDVKDSLAKGIQLREDEVYIFLPKAKLEAKKLVLGDREYKITGISSKSAHQEFLMEDIILNAYVVLPNLHAVEMISEYLFKEQKIAYLSSFDLEADRQGQLNYYEQLKTKLSGEDIQVEGAEAARIDFHIVYGGIFFTGVFLGLVFLVAVVLIIYYKQLIEGYEDRKRYEIMQKVGMSDQEVKQSIRSQVLIVFFMPLIMAGIHLCFAFPILSNLLILFNMNNTRLFLINVLCVYFAFAAVYLLVYTLTSKVYYGLVKRK